VNKNEKSVNSNPKLSLNKLEPSNFLHLVSDKQISVIHVSMNYFIAMQRGEIVKQFVIH
jgi:hypothetical protein